MRRIRQVCYETIDMINALIGSLKPINDDSISNCEYRQQLKYKVDDIKERLLEINALENTIISDVICEDNSVNCLLVDFDNFKAMDMKIFNDGAFLDELIELKEKIIEGCY